MMVSVKFGFVIDHITQIALIWKALCLSYEILFAEMYGCTVSVVEFEAYSLRCRFNNMSHIY